MDRYLRCPLQAYGARCTHTEWVSPEDEDASLSEMLSHIRWSHPKADPINALHRATLTTEQGEQ